MLKPEDLLHHGWLRVLQAGVWPWPSYSPPSPYFFLTQQGEDAPALLTILAHHLHFPRFSVSLSIVPRVLTLAQARLPLAVLPPWALWGWLVVVPLGQVEDLWVREGLTRRCGDCFCGSRMGSMMRPGWY